jgi:hypothetical protein
LVVPAGSKVSFPNGDPIFHNVFSLSKAKSFDLGYFPQGQTRTVVFDKPGVIDVFCHLHPNMSSTILVVPNAAWVRPDTEGNIAFKDLPPGDYEVVAWHRAAGFFRRKVTVAEGAPATVTFLLPVREDGPR